MRRDFSHNAKNGRRSGRNPARARRFLIGAWKNPGGVTERMGHIARCGKQERAGERISSTLPAPSQKTGRRHEKHAPFGERSVRTFSAIPNAFRNLCTRHTGAETRFF